MVRFTRYRGVVHIWVAVLMVVFIGFVGLAIDMGYATLTAQQLQAGADAAALAGATYVRIDQDEARARTVAIAAANTAGGSAISLSPNPGNAPDGEVVIGRFETETGLFVVTTDEPNAVRVNAARAQGSTGGPLELFFGQVFGVETTDVRRTATAIVGGHLPVGALILARLGPCAFQMRGTASSMVVNNGAVYINSDSLSAACASGHPSVTADEILIHGGFSPSFGSIDFNREIFTGVDEVADPLARLPEPSRPLLPGADVTVNGNETVTLTPGYYQDITMNNGNLLLAPGVYYIDGEMRVTGGNLLGSNVMLFIGPNGSLNLGGNGRIKLTAMNTMHYPAGPGIPASMADERVLIFQSRSNSHSATLRGTGDLALDGRIYMPNNHLGIGGTGGAVGTGLIVGTLEIFGDGDVVVDADPFLIPKVRFVYLVE